MGPTDEGWHDIPGGGMDRQAYWDGQQWTGETRSKPDPNRGVGVVAVFLGILVVVFLLFAAWVINLLILWS